MNPYKNRKQYLQKLAVQMDNERNSFESGWREISDYIFPRRSRFFTSDVNKGDRRNNKIVDSTGTFAARTLRSGMMSGVTSPARPWFRLSASNPFLAENQKVKQWLYSTTNAMVTAFLRSNLYNALPIVYGDMGTFATGCMMVERDKKNLFHFRVFPIGSYSIGVDSKSRINKFKRDFKMTVSQIVDAFVYNEDTNSYDWSKCSQKVKDCWKNGNTEAWIEVRHFIYPNEKYIPESPFARSKKFASVYFEYGKSAKDHEAMLQESGYDLFPVFAPRWEVTGEDIYGTESPAILSIGDIKQLQIVERRGLQGLEKQINPPTIGPSSLRKSKVSTLPGDITYADGEDLKAMRPFYQVQYDLNAVENKQQQTRQRISRAFYEDLFLMLAQSDRRQITAREIQERHEEKLLALGPVLEQLNQDLLDPLIDVCFAMMFDEGMIAPPPDELSGTNLKVEYISIMAQAQKLVGLSGVERFANFAGNIAGVDQRVLDKINGDQLIDVYGDLTSIPPGIVRSDEDVAEIRKQRAEAQAAAQRAEQQQMEAQTAKTLSETKVGDEGNALESLAQAGT